MRLADTLEVCDKAEIARAGAGVDIDSALEPAWLAVAGSKIGLLSVACTLPMESDAAVGKPGIAPIHIGFSFEVDTNLLSEQPGTMPAVHSWASADDVERVCTRISAMKQQGDTVIVAIHWGVPNFWLSPAQGLLAEYQQPLGHALIDAGADVIVGTHSHSLHPVEIYQGKPIFYSLGNFLFEGPRDFMEPESVVVRINTDDETSVEVVPLMIDERGFPYRTRGPESTQVLAKLQAMSKQFGTEIQFDEDCGRIVIHR